MDDIVKWMIRGTLIMIGSISMWIAKTTYANNQDINVMKNDIPTIKEDVKDIKENVKIILRLRR